jgi:hypothetical protein
VVQTPEGILGGAWFEVFFPERPRPERARVQLVETGGTRRFRVQRRPYYEDEQSLAGRVIGRLTPDRTYDVQILVPDGEPIVLPAAFTARAPRFASLYSPPVARGEMVYALVDFAPKRLRFRVNGMPARLLRQNDGDGGFAFEVPRLTPGVSTGTVTASAFGVSTEAPQQLEIVSGRHELSAFVDGDRRSCTSYEWSEVDGRVVVQGNRWVVNDARSAAMSFVLWLPSTFDALTAPATFTAADGAAVQWGNTRDFGSALPGQVGVFMSQICTITVDSIDGNRIRGRFTAHCIDAGYLSRPPDGRELDVTEGRYDVHLAPPRGD